MPLPKVTLASAGSGKTYDIIESALSDFGRRVLIVTYTDQNLRELRKEIISRCGVIPNSIHLLSWYSFLLRHCVRPYQHPLYSANRIEGVYFPSSDDEATAIRNRRYIGKERVEDYYIVGQRLIVGEFAADFAVKCDELNNGAVFRRLEGVYDVVFIDEVQDLAGYDLVMLERLFASNLQIEVVGDCRQVTYKTNSVSAKYRQYRDEKLLGFFKSLEEKGLCHIALKTTSRRCNQAICNFADQIFPEFPRTTSQGEQVTGHDGIFFVSSREADYYFRKYRPQVLRWNRQSTTCSDVSLNFGESKGLTFDRVLIYPTSPIKTFLRTATIAGMPSASRAKFYVAVTRARHSVAFVYDGEVHKSFSIQKKAVSGLRICDNWAE